LQHAFERGIVHRDIKPSNLIVATYRNGDGAPTVKILDFGLARFQSEESEAADRLTQMGRMLGTIDYIAPEQAQDARNADIRADIYSLGCTLYFALTGKPPFEGADMIEKLGPRVTGEAPWVRTVRPDVPPALEEVLRKLMARLPADRYQTPAEAAEALTPFAAAVPLAIPVEEPVAEGVALAIPLNSPDSVSQAREASQERKPAEENRPARPKSHVGQPGAWKPVAVVLLIGGGIVAISLIAGVIVLGLYFRTAHDKKTGVIRFSKVKWSMPDEMATPGKTHNVLVWIDRVDCKGKVRITLTDLPPGVVAKEVVLPPSNEVGVGFTVSYGTEPLKKEIKVVAECEDGARAEFPLTLTVKEDPLKKK
jgi:hypothetical protein